MGTTERSPPFGDGHARVLPLALAGSPGDLRIWRLALDLEAPIPEPDAALLDAGERARLEGFQRHADKVRFGVTRAMLKRLLAGPAMNAAAVRLAYTDTGRPVWPGSALHFNVAHSGALALIAISDCRPVGIDVELRTELDIGALAAAVLAPPEQRLLEQAPITARRDAFYRYWVCKEAALKATGHGIADALRRIEVRADAAAGDARFIHCDDAGMADRDLLRSLHLRLLPLPADYTGAVAWACGAPYP
ncbi:4'-phosphopantetheinyl transferase family protein [Bordetella sp. H567]|uniref:4'-phosphopantetheinyl transferase family protein n=1 Tax=Bordetella sp. H567 TaxID=1697043 RepID=UPI00082E3070|nr:4'-phosphopantetheinyl transferase superfamily protein [Bordetella sp. H567]